MKVLVACESSGTVRDAFIALGHDAMSCDLLESVTKGPHYCGDVRDILSDGWDLLIAHPPCTYLSNSSVWALGDGPYHQKVKPSTLVGEARRQAQREAIAFFRLLWQAPIPRIAIENPTGVASTLICKPTQIVHPHQFGNDASKGTCLWLKGLPALCHTQHIAPRIVNGMARWSNQTDSGQNRLPPSIDRWRIRSQTYSGIADAMAQQWGCGIVTQPELSF